MAVPLGLVLFLMTVPSFARKVSDKVFPLDMAEKSVDDSYEGCRENMKNKVLSRYLEQEKKKTPGFAAAWNQALNKRKKHELGKYQSAAIYMYTKEPKNENNFSYKKFNEATRDGSQAYLSDKFQFYTLHFFLTDAIQQLKRNCVTTYRRTKVKFVTNVLKKKIRFGSFTSTSVYMNVTRFGEVSCFQVKTCEGAAIAKYSAMEVEKEVLIPPYEVFEVTAIKKRSQDKNLWCEVVYELKSNGTLSNLQCKKSK
ncbi:NAD(P)(+)--arginine ADP-ribosyltransferase 1-like [Hoplias malabaricus]|uniref:NAD(P)(+)--arginine ADP-ribosyltransferase 1-like n=1 Tax=Hoplias malabaricus TaxID=27720 RepID=UPI0034623940